MSSGFSIALPAAPVLPAVQRGKETGANEQNRTGGTRSRATGDRAITAIPMDRIILQETARPFLRQRPKIYLCNGRSFDRPSLLMSWVCALLLFLCCLFISRAPGSAAEAEPKRILVLYSYGRNIAPSTPGTPTFQTALAEHSTAPIEFYEVSLPGSLFEPNQADEPTVDYLHALCGGHKPDLIVPCSWPAVRFVQRLRAKLCPSVPLLLMGGNERFKHFYSVHQCDNGCSELRCPEPYAGSCPVPPILRLCLAAQGWSVSGSRNCSGISRSSQTVSASRGLTITTLGNCWSTLGDYPLTPLFYTCLCLSMPTGCHMTVTVP
jgi:hypothetical protein